jgi:hypothetical protein
LYKTINHQTTQTIDYQNHHCIEKTIHPKISTTKESLCQLGKLETHKTSTRIMDIDDILASVSNAERIPQRTSDLQALTRAWVAERCAPELLPYPEELIDRVMDRIKVQVRNIISSYCFVFSMKSFGRRRRDGF